jgi:hypothetical protein
MIGGGQIVNISVHGTPPSSAFSMGSGQSERLSTLTTITSLSMPCGVQYSLHPSALHHPLATPPLATPPGLFRVIFLKGLAVQHPILWKGAAPILPWPTPRFERDARLTLESFKGMAVLAASLCYRCCGCVWVPNEATTTQLSTSAPWSLGRICNAPQGPLRGSPLCPTHK